MKCVLILSIKYLFIICILNYETDIDYQRKKIKSTVPTVKLWNFSLLISNLIVKFSNVLDQMLIPN